MAHRRFRSIQPIQPILLAAAALAACAPGDEAARNDALPAVTDSATPPPALGALITGFETPESVRYDPQQDVYFVANINGGPAAKDDNGYITRVHADSLGFPMMRWISAGRNNVSLHAPKGMALVGDTLWVADIDQMRAFNRRTGDPLGSVDLAPAGALFLNDVAVGGDGALYVTDSGLRFGEGGAITSPGPFRIFRLQNRAATVAVQGDTLARPNGIAWDTDGRRFVLGPLASPTISTWAPGDAAPTPVATGPGNYDGIEAIGGGRVLITSWADSSLYEMDARGRLRRLVAGLDSPADIGWDPVRRRVAVPLFAENRVVFYDLDPAAALAADSLSPPPDSAAAGAGP